MSYEVDGPYYPMERRILERFAEDYPCSAQARGGRQLRKGGWEKVFTEIEIDPEAKDEFLSAVERLVKEGIVSVKWAPYREGDRVNALYLESPELLYKVLNTPSPEHRRKNILRMIREFDFDLSCPLNMKTFIKGLFHHVKARLEEGIPTPCTGPDSFEDLLKLLSIDSERSAKLPQRALSIRLYNDSKRLGRLLPEADKLCLAAVGEKLSEKLDLSRKYPQAGMRGRAECVFQDGRKWRLNGESIFMFENTISRLSLISAEAPVLIVENKETFMTFPWDEIGFGALVYSGGHLNPALRALLRLLSVSDIELYYFGDLDPDGLFIFEQADNLLSGSLQAWHMDREHYLKYLEFGYPLSVGSLSRLKQLKSGKLDDLADLIRINKKGVEQEIMGWD